MNRKRLIALVILILCLTAAGGYLSYTRPGFLNIPVADPGGTPDETRTSAGSEGVTQLSPAPPAAETDNTRRPVLGDLKKGGKTGGYTSFVVCIDPGHSSDGGDGRGTVNGTTELEINWEVAHRLKTVLEERYGVQVVMTRGERDKVVGNRQRAEVANNAKADLFLRLHCDWEASGKSSGFTFYYPGSQGTAEGATGPSEEVIQASGSAARSLHTGTAASLDKVLPDHGVKTDDSTYIGHQQGGALTGSIHSRVPVVLIEMVYLSNKKDAEFIKSREGQEMIADSLAEGIAEYLNGIQ